MSKPHSQLKTEFVCIATAGTTADGRTISEQELFEMAETYNPETYTALIWLEHYRFFGNLGQVLSLKTEKVNGTVKLFAELRPTAELVELNQSGQKVFTSIEIKPNFAGTGKAYLGGLAVTDSPASIGTTQLNFSTRGVGENDVIVGNAEPFHFNLKTENSESFVTALLDVFKKFTSSNVDPSKPHIEPTFSDNHNNNEENQPMTEEQMQKFAAVIATAVAAQFSQQPPAEPKAEPEPAKAEEAKAVTAEEFNSLQAKFNALEEKFNALSQAEVTPVPKGVGDKEKTKFNMAV